MAVKLSGTLKIPSGSGLKLSAPGADPFSDNNVLLVGFDGNFNDESSSNHTPNVVGSVTTGTTDALFAGNSVGQFPDSAVNTHYVEYGSSNDFLLQPQQDWTIELFFNQDELKTGYMVPLWIGDGSANISTGDGYGFFIIRNAAISNTRKMAARYIIGGSIQITAVSSDDVGTNVWRHCAMTCEGATRTIEFFFDGVSQGSAVVANSSVSASTFCSLGKTTGVTGGSGGRVDFDGQMEEVRITKGVRRYTGNFTPPTEPFPRS